RTDAGPDPAPVAELPASPPRRSLPVSISRFDRLIVHHAKAHGFDWRLIAALIFEESRFNPNSRSSKGAVGLMQVRPIAGDAVGYVERTLERYGRYQRQTTIDLGGDRISSSAPPAGDGPGSAGRRVASRR